MKLKHQTFLNILLMLYKFYSVPEAKVSFDWVYSKIFGVLCDFLRGLSTCSLFSVVWQCSIVVVWTSCSLLSRTEYGKETSEICEQSSLMQDIIMT